jgi:hypothetical protein
MYLLSLSLNGRMQIFSVSTDRLCGLKLGIREILKNLKIHPNNSWVKKEITREIIKYFDTNGIQNATY